MKSSGLSQWSSLRAPDAHVVKSPSLSYDAAGLNAEWAVFSNKSQLSWFWLVWW